MISARVVRAKAASVFASLRRDKEGRRTPRRCARFGGPWQSRQRLGVRPALWRFPIAHEGDNRTSNNRVWLVYLRADRVSGGSCACRTCESGGGPPHSKTLRAREGHAQSRQRRGVRPALWRFPIAHEGDNRSSNNRVWLVYLRADRVSGGSCACRTCESGVRLRFATTRQGGPPHSETLREVRGPMAVAPASWSAPALWRFPIAHEKGQPKFQHHVPIKHIIHLTKLGRCAILPPY
jgi:hypothetical protein